MLTVPISHCKRTAKMKYFREVNEDNVLIRNILGEFEDSLKYVSELKCNTKNNQHRHTYVT